MDRYLIKIINKQYKRKTLSGKLHFNTIDYFINNGNSSQKDWFEGASLRANKEELKILFPKDMLDVMSTDLRGIYKGYKYVHILSFSLVEKEYNSLARSYAFKMLDYKTAKEFGNVCLIVKDPNELLNRIIKRCNKLGYLVASKVVVYYQEPIYTKSKDNNVYAKMMMDIKKEDEGYSHITMLMKTDIGNPLFSKIDRYNYEKEYRLVLLTNIINKDSIDLDIGDIKDIVTTINVDDNFQENVMNVISINNFKSLDSKKVITNSDLTSVYDKARSYDDEIEIFFCI